jgi:hypothetical protein
MPHYYYLTLDAKKKQTIVIHKEESAAKENQLCTTMVRSHPRGTKRGGLSRVAMGATLGRPRMIPDRSPRYPGEELKAG